MSQNIQETINHFKSLGDWVMSFDFFAISGWLFGLICAVTAIVQCIKKEKCYKKLKINQRNDRGSTGYQAKNMTFNNKK
jgi:hypothetical protein